MWPKSVNTKKRTFQYHVRTHALIYDKIMFCIRFSLQEEYCGKTENKELGNQFHLEGAVTQHDQIL